MECDDRAQAEPVVCYVVEIVLYWYWHGARFGGSSGPFVLPSPAEHFTASAVFEKCVYNGQIGTTSFAAGCTFRTR